MSRIVAAWLVAWLTAAAAASCGHGHSGPPPSPPARPLPLRRPPAAQRTFHSPEVERQLEAMLNRSWLDPELRTLFHNCMPNTLDTTVWQAPTAADPSLTTFISTGDIAAMWLRDSQNQVRLGLGLGLGLDLDLGLGGFKAAASTRGGRAHSARQAARRSSRPPQLGRRRRCARTA